MSLPYNYYLRDILTPYRKTLRSPKIRFGSVSLLDLSFDFSTQGETMRSRGVLWFHGVATSGETQNEAASVDHKHVILISKFSARLC